MKRAYALLLVLLLILSGCSNKNRAKDISVKDVCCPYEITHKKDGVELTLQDGENRGIGWNVEAVPEDICQVTQADTDKENTVRYRITGNEDGAANLTFTAVQADGADVFVLNLIVTVDADGKTEVYACEHQEVALKAVEENGLTYKWNVDAEGYLNFSFINSDDRWRVSGDGEGVCAISNALTMPGGCMFRAEALSPGKTTVELVGAETQRIIRVTIQVDDSGNLELKSVQEQ